ncbi:hypothetical protein AcV7_008855 [Taiwanofungus camphoratus]|nr:hypothetical protein AcV7_008855 [Antrodia cinnamomea]
MIIFIGSYSLSAVLTQHRNSPPDKYCALHCRSLLVDILSSAAKFRHALPYMGVLQLTYIHIALLILQQRGYNEGHNGLCCFVIRSQTIITISSSTSDFGILLQCLTFISPVNSCTSERAVRNSASTRSSQSICWMLRLRCPYTCYYEVRRRVVIYSIASRTYMYALPFNSSLRSPG